MCEDEWRWWWWWWPKDERLLSLLGLGGDEGFGEKGWEMTESWARRLLERLRRSEVLGGWGYESFSLYS